MNRTAGVRFAGAVLAGGRSRRMGRDKAFIDVDAVPMVRRVAEALDAAGATAVTVVGGDRPRLEALGLRVRDDPTPFAGPLAALITALDEAPAGSVTADADADAEIVVVLACDLPDPSSASITATVAALGDADAAVPTDGGHAQWLHGAWRRRCRSTLETAYDGGERSIRGAIAGLDVRTVTGIDPRHLADADSPADLAARPTGAGTTSYAAAMDMAEIDIDEFARRREQGVPVLDVRQPDEFEEAHVPGAVLIPLDQLSDRLDEVPEGDLHVICKMGGRSAKAVEFLASQDVTATNIAGGTMGWIEAGHPVDRGAGSA